MPSRLRGTRFTYGRVFALAVQFDLHFTQLCSLFLRFGSKRRWLLCVCHLSWGNGVRVVLYQHMAHPVSKPCLAHDRWRERGECLIRDQEVNIKGEEQNVCLLFSTVGGDCEGSNSASIHKICSGFVVFFYGVNGS